MKWNGNFTRIQGGATDSLDTHKSKYYLRGLSRCTQNMVAPLICDPFARNCQWGTVTNDIDPDTKAQHHMDALDFLRSQPTSYFDLVLFDPPFSEGQAERYGEGVTNVYTKPGYVPALFAEIFRILKTGGKVLKLGYNSTRHNDGFVLLEAYVINFGGNRNDVIMTIWMKGTETLELWSV